MGNGCNPRCASCATIVPLLNWSKTLRRLGSINDGASGSRTVIIYWGFLVAVGTFCLMQLLYDVNSTFSWIDSPGLLTETFPCFLHHPHHNISVIDFVPPALSFNETINGTLRTVSFLDAEWVSYHGCTDICRKFHVSTLFRSQGEYQTLTQKELRTNLFDDFGLYITPKESLLTRYMTAILGGSKLVIPFIMIQGIMAATFGRRNPRQVRDVIYVSLRDIKLPSLIISLIAYHGTHTTQGTEKCKKWLAKFFSSCTYGCALLATILCLPVLLLIITALEFKLYGLPQSESAIHVGAWTFWAGTGLVLSASFVLKFHDQAVMGLSNILRHCIRNVFQPIKTQQTMETDRRGFRGYGKLMIRKFGQLVRLSTSKIYVCLTFSLVW